MILRAKHLFVCLIAATALLGCPPSGPPPNLLILSPTQGEFVSGTSVIVTLDVAKSIGSTITVNGTPVVGAPNIGTIDVTVPIDPGQIFNPIIAEFSKGTIFIRRRVTIVAVDDINSHFVADGSLSSQAVGMRIGNTGLAQITPVVESLSAGSLDVSDLITGQNPIAQGSMAGINYTANAVEVGFGGFGMTTAATTGQIDMTISIDDFFVELDLELGFLGSCTLEISSSTTDITGGYDLQPLASAPSQVDVNLVTPVGVVLGGFNSQFVSGICNDPLIGDIVNLIMGPSQLQALVQDGFETSLGDPDGTGPQDSPLAAAIQTALAGIDIAGPLGAGLGGTFNAPIDQINEDVDGLTLVVDADIHQSTFHPEAPDLPGSLGLAETFPTFAATTPVGGLPYGMAFGISSTAMNQLLKAQIEGGLMIADLTEIDLGGFVLALTTTTMSAFVPELLGIYPGTDPFEIHLRPQMAPVFTGNPGPGGELAELAISALQIDLVHVPSGDIPVSMQVDVNLGINLDLAGGGLSFIAVVPPGASINVTITENEVGTNEGPLIATMQAIFPLLAGTLGDALGAFPFPSLLGMDIATVEISRLGTFLGVFADLLVVPTSEIQNVSSTDQSILVEGYHDGGCWIGEYRRRTSVLALGNTIKSNLKGMLGSDSGCTTNDQTWRAQNEYRVNFDIVGVAGEQWTLDIDHSILGAYTIYDESNLVGDGGGTAQFQSAVQGQILVDGIPQGTFDFNPNVTSLHHPVSGSAFDSIVDFSGSNATHLVGTGNAAIQLNFRFDMRAHSNSNVVFPAITGDEVAIRFGKNDTIDNNVTAGSDPGAGSRDIGADGHKDLVTLTAVPIP